MRKEHKQGGENNLLFPKPRGVCLNENSSCWVFFKITYLSRGVEGMFRHHPGLKKQKQNNNNKKNLSGGEKQQA